MTMQHPALVISGNPTVNGDINTHVYISCNHEPHPIGQQSTERKDTTDDLKVNTAHADKFRDHRKDETIYQIKNELTKGRLLLVSNEFEDPNLKGYKEDRLDMVELWGRIGCDVIIKCDLFAKEIEKAVDEFVLEGKNAPANMYVVIIMSHGSKDDLIIGKKSSGTYADNIIRKIINSNYLKDKPKLIFFQMCRGKRADISDEVRYTKDDESWIADRLGILDGGESMQADYPVDGVDTLRTAKDYVSKTPDVLLAFASQPDYMAFVQSTGSWFVQSIKKRFASYASVVHVNELMKMVKKDVGNKRARGKDHAGAKQDVDYRTTFGKKRLFLFPGFPEKMKDQTVANIDI